MKRIRMMILIGLIVAALAVTVIPSFAADPFNAGNWSFEADNNGDGYADKWNTKGAVYRLCDGGMYDDCMMVFPPSNKGAALWQRFDGPNKIVVTSQEGQNVNLGNGQFKSQQLDAYRAYFGYRFKYNDGSTVLVYDDIPGGTRTVYTTIFYSIVNVPLDYDAQNGELAHVSWGIVALPGSGSLGVEWLYATMLVS